MDNKFRLTSKAFEREKEEEKIEPRRILFLSMEGTNTEKEYLLGLNKFKKELKFNSLISIIPLSRCRKDGSSAPQHVVELLEEYLILREEGVETQIGQLLENKFSPQIISQYLADPKTLQPSVIKAINIQLDKIGYDLQYKKFLAGNKNSGDLFGIVIDKDNWSNIDEIIKYCKEKEYYVFITNPCFELWLLFHWLDITTLSEDKLSKIKDNPKCSNRQTYVSQLLNTYGHHSKSKISFETNYLNKIDVAIVNASKFTTDINKLSTEIGTNWPDLINLLKGT